MERAYRQLYGAPGEVLYPMRDESTAIFTEPPARLHEAQVRPVAAHVGTINSPEIVSMLGLLADTLSEWGGRLLLFGPPGHHVARSTLLERENIVHRGFVQSSQELKEICRAEATFLYVPFPFTGQSMSLSFPSKFIEYTSMALPIVVHAPLRCPLMEWVREHPASVAAVNSMEPQALRDALQRLTFDPEYVVALANAAAAAGASCFSQEAIFNVFLDAIQCDGRH